MSNTRLGIAVIGDEDLVNGLRLAGISKYHIIKEIDQDIAENVNRALAKLISESERLKTETDPVEIRMLTLELSNAQAMAKNLELENQNKTAAALTAKNVLESNLRSHAKEKNYNLLDTSLFSHLGDKAIETLDAHHANTQTVFDAELSKIAQSKYGMTPEELSKRTPDKPKMTLDQIEALPTREERLEAMKEAGY